MCLAGGQPPHGDHWLSTRFSTPSPPSFHGYHGNSGAWRLEASWLPWQVPCMAIGDFPFHPPPSSSPLITMAIYTGGEWVLTYPTDPYYPKLLPTKPQPILTPHNTLSSWLYRSYKNWAAIARAQLLRPCSLGQWTSPESTLSIKLALSLFALLFGSNLTFPSMST
jgi:hypothetical protein